GGPPDGCSQNGDAEKCEALHSTCLFKARFSIERARAAQLALTEGIPAPMWRGLESCQLAITKEKPPFSPPEQVFFPPTRRKKHPYFPPENVSFCGRLVANNGRGTVPRDQASGRAENSARKVRRDRTSNDRQATRRAVIGRSCDANCFAIPRAKREKKEWRIP